MAFTGSDAAPYSTPAPLPVAARILKVYFVPLVRPVTVCVSVAAPVGEMSCQLPASCCNCQPEMPVSDGLAQLSVTCSMPATWLGVGAWAGNTVMLKASVAVFRAAVESVAV